MNRLVRFPLLLMTGVLFACTDGTSLPNATGKATISAINAIDASPSIIFRIEEANIGAITYGSASAAVSYDDLDYTFNFDVLFAGDADLTRFASQHIDVVADQHYLFLATGSLAAPNLTLLEFERREFTAGETVFQARFAHTLDAVGTVDVYLAAEGVAPVLGEQLATLSFGDISAPVELEAGALILTITTSNDPTDILYQSAPGNALAGSELIITAFDGSGSDTGPVVVRGFNIGGGTVGFADPLFPPTIQFLGGARDLGDSDIYDDEALTSQVLASHSFMELSPDTPIMSGSRDYFYVPAGDTSVVTIETTVAVTNGVHYRVISIGTGGTYATVNYTLDRSAVDTSAKINFFNATTNYNFTDLYVVARGTSISDETPLRSRITSLANENAVAATAGSYDVYITDFGQSEVLAGPLPIDVSIGDVVDLVAFDTVDPAILELVEFPVP